MTGFMRSNLLPKAMQEAGFPLPANCREARLIMGADSALMIQYDVFLTDEDLGKLGKALQQCAEIEPPKGALIR